MKIAFVHNLPSGGGKRSAFDFIKSMVKNHTVDLFYIDETSENYMDVRDIVNNVILVPGPKTKGGLGIIYSMIKVKRIYAEVARKINNGGYDLAFVMQCKICNSPFVLKYLQIPSLYYCQEPLARSLESHNWDRGWLNFFKKTVFRLRVYIDWYNAQGATLICANSRYSVENIYRYYGVYPRFSKLGVDINHFRPLGLKRKLVVLCVGELSASKSQDFIIESISTMKVKPTIHFIYNSTNKNYKSYIQKLADSHDVIVKFDELVKDEELIKAYNSASVILYTSKLEPFGFVPLEAMACGTPIIGIAEGGIRETIIHNKTGFLTERDTIEYGKAIETLLEDELLRKIMGQNGRQYVSENWTLDQSYIELEKNLYRTANLVLEK